MTPDVEVDVVSPDDDGDGQEEGGVSFHPERDPLSEEIVKQLEKGLPRWPGLGEYGWMQEVKPVRLFLIQISSSKVIYRTVFRTLWPVSKAIKM